MDAQEVDKAVLVQTSWSTWDNGYIADAVALYPHRFFGHGLIDPLEKSNAEQARYWVKDRGLAGFRFHPMYYPDRKILTIPENGSLWEEVADLGAVVQFHLRPEDAEQVDTVAPRCPGNIFILDHMGYPDADRTIAQYQPILDLARHPNVFFKLSYVNGRSKLPFPHEDVHAYIQKALDAFGSERMLWGTGYPGHHRAKHNWPSLADELRLIREGLPFLRGDQIENILGTNAARIWNQ
jgi:predicted TIM-barrel fold metal-dependent hydrolase